MQRVGRWNRAVARPALALWLALCLCAVALGSVRADTLRQGDTLSFGEPASGVLGAETFRRVYTFRADAGDQITLGLTRTAGDLDPYLLLMNADGAVIAASDDGGDGVDARIAGWHAPASDLYFVVVTRFGQEHGSTSGSYSLLLTRAEIQTANGTAIALGSTTLGRITSQEPVAFYFLRAERGDVLDLSMRRTSGDLDPHLDLATSDGRIIASNDDDPLAQGTLDAAIHNYTVLDSGTYVVVATRFGQEAGNTQGSYILSAGRAAPDALGVTADRARLIDYGQSMQGDIDETLTGRYYWFEAKRGDVVTIDQETDEGNLDPMVRLLDANFTELAANDNSGTRGLAEILAYTLPDAGRYYILATRSGEAEGETTGTYTLTLDGRLGVIGGHALELPYSGSATGIIDNDHLTEEYVFFGSEGDVITVTMERTENDLDALLTIQDSARKQLIFDDDGAGNQNAQLDRFVLPRDDMYIIVASRYDGAVGTTSGSYLLSLDLVRAGR
ncbi:PPC domain-containing protein [Aggregatilinea lenta]|uniref:PPC domain-containing protein n=1 Tax=Aggregatilinea lenta TaxID=913108 RepID=UPI000E5B78E5|nr:PPC domain-containing protein [Aggregatilinea lenta]